VGSGAKGCAVLMSQIERINVEQIPSVFQLQSGTDNLVGQRPHRPSDNFWLERVVASWMLAPVGR